MLHNSNQLSEILFQGYQGMVDGGDNIVEVSWESVSSILQVVSVRGWEWDPNPLSLKWGSKILDPGKQM